MTSTNPIRLTDRFLIERLDQSGMVAMTVDGHDLKEFTLDLQSAFTADVEVKVFSLENQADALELDLYEFINITQPADKQEVLEEIDELNNKAVSNHTQIGITQDLCDEIRQTTRIVGKFILQSPETDTSNLNDGDMTLRYGSSDPKLSNVTGIWLRDIDLLKLDVGISERSTFDNIMVGDIVEISSSQSLTVTFRAVYVVKEVIEQSRRVRLNVEHVTSFGDGEGIPWQDDTNPDDNPRTRRDTRVEIFPSIPTESFALKSEYIAMLESAYPIGIVVAWFKDDIPEGYMKCDGSSIPNDDKHQELRNMFPDGTPNLKGRALIATGNYGLTHVNTNVEQTTSRPQHVPISSEAGGHVHTNSMTSAGQHYHQYGDNTKGGGGTTYTAYGGQNGGSYKTSEAGSHTHPVTINENGSHTHEIIGWDNYNRMMSRTCHFIIKAYHVKP